MPPSRLTTAKPASSVTSSPANTGRRPANGASAMKAAIAWPLSHAGRLELEHHLALEQHERALARRDRPPRPSRGRRRLLLRAPCGSAARASGPCPRAARPDAARRTPRGARVRPSRIAGSGLARTTAVPRLRRSRPCSPAALSRSGANSRSSCSSERPLTRASAPLGRPLQVGQDLAQPLRAPAPRPARARSRPACRRRRGTARSHRRGAQAAMAGRQRTCGRHQAPACQP